MSEAGNQQEPSMEEILASIRKIISEDGDDEQQEAAAEEAGAEEAPLELVEEAEPEEAPLELTDEAVPEEEHEIEFVEEEPEPMAAEAAIPEPEPEPEPVFEPEPIPEPVFAAPPAPVAFGEKPAEFEEKIVSGSALQAGAAAFGELARTVRPDRAPGGGITVEQLASDLMRPMLREWLDENLPGMVERLVKREIERMARNGDDE